MEASGLRSRAHRMGERIVTHTLTEEEEARYSALADTAERGELKQLGPALGSRTLANADDLASFMVTHGVTTGGRPNLGRARATGHGRSPRRQVRLPEDLNNRLDAYADAKDLTVSDVIRAALEAYLQPA